MFRSRWCFVLAACIEQAVGVYGQWQSLDGGVNWEVRSFGFNSDSSLLRVGGTFAWAGADSVRANGLAWWDGSAWSNNGLAGGNGDTSVAGWMWDPVVSQSLFHDTLFIGYLGDWWHFQELGPSTYLADGQWQACGMPDDIVFHFQLNDRLFFGGRADSLFGQPMPGVNEWVNGGLVTLPNNPFPWAETYAGTYWHDKYYFGGVLLALGCRKILAFDGDSTWEALGGGVGGNFISKIRGYGDSLYVGGFFNYPGLDVQSQHIQIWDGTNWLPFFPQVEFISGVKDIQVHEGKLYIAGIYQWQGDTTWYGLLRYDGHELCTIGGPMPSGDNGVMAFYQNDLYLALGGTFPALLGEFIGRLPLDGLMPDTCVVVSPAAVHEYVATSSLRVFPVPASDAITLVVPDGGIMFAISDAFGREVLRGACSIGANKIDLGNLPAGHYRIRVTDRARTTIGVERFTKI